jgi:hypothetical protein
MPERENNTISRLYAHPQLASDRLCLLLRLHRRPEDTLFVINTNRLLSLCFKKTTPKTCQSKQPRKWASREKK